MKLQYLDNGASETMNASATSSRIFHHVVIAGEAYRHKTDKMLDKLYHSR
jgi:hypothetical protein